MARKPKYNEEIHNKIIQLIEKGYIDKEVCKSVNINTTTYYEWQDEKSKLYKKELTNSIKEAKKVIDCKVEQKLFKRSMGYKYNEITKELVKDIEGNEELKVTKIVTKEVVPDVGAQIFWLKNRQPDRWRDTKNIVNTIEDPVSKMLEISKKLKGE
jgi:hypothetical protein